MNFIHRYLWSYDHKVVAKQYLFTALFFLLVGGTLALLLRWQIAWPGRPVPLLGPWLKGRLFFGADGAVSPDGYLQLTSMHGLIMIFFVVIPLVVGGFGNFLIPLQIGARDVAFPWLNALSYWLYLPSGLLMLAAFFLPHGAAQAGWTNYPPLSDSAGASQGTAGLTLALSAVYFVGFSSILGGVNFVATIVLMRAPGMTWSRLPLLTWAQLDTAVFQALATPMLAAGGTLLLFDRFFEAGFFLPQGLEVAGQTGAGASGGYPLLWQHIFWFYAHPAVYILILPAMGVASEIIPVFARKPIFGYMAMAISLVSIMGLGFMVWGHHMFVSGMNPVLGMAFMISTMAIAVPSGVKVLNWLATVWGSSMRLESPMLYALSFVSMFIAGGLSGIFLAATPVDMYLHDTYYIIGHFHYIVFGGTLFTVFAGLTYWYPKMFGRMMNEGWNRLHWLLTFVSFHLTFFPMHFLGEAGHMRRLADSTGYRFLNPMASWNERITLAAMVLGFSQLIFLGNFLGSLWRGKKASANPWQANTLEWTVSSPPPAHNFDKIPVVVRWPYDYSQGPADAKDWMSQTEP
jgi:cytochrome c oxidase subunit 1